MGNFSVNHYTKIQLEPGGASVLFVLDLGEIPSHDFLQKWPAPKDAAPELVKQLHVTSNGKPVPLQFVDAQAVAGQGAGKLPVIRLTSRLKLAAQPGQLEYEDGTFPEISTGWKEIVVVATGGTGIRKSTAGPHDLSAALTVYPPGAATPHTLKATLEWTATPVENPIITEAAPVPAPNVEAPQPTAPAKKSDFLQSALNGGEISWGLGLACVAVAFWFGALHALEPGHGKTMVAAYLVGSRGTFKHAVLLGAIVTFTHTISVFFLGLVTLFLSQYIMPDKISKVLGIVSGLTIVYLGAMLLYKRTMGAGSHSHDHHHDHHHHHHDEFDDNGDMAFPAHTHTHSHGAFTHTHDGHTHSHVPDGDVTMKSLVALGASGGLVPCPSALVLLLSAISIGRTGFGLLLLVSFSLGLALVLMAMGMLVVFAKGFFPESQSDKPNLFFRYMPIVSAAIIFVIGIVLTGNSLGLIPVMRLFG